MNSASEHVVHWIEDDEQLAAAVSRWGPVLGLDTEFIRTSTFFPLPGLYQVASEGEVYLIDPLQITQWQPFQDVLSDAQVVKIMHACQEDLELLHHHLGVTMAGLFDTQFAQAFLGEQFSLSYAALVQLRLDVALDKHETRSDWLARPLSARQIDYAVEDVVYLEALYDGLHAELDRTEKLAWFDSEMRQRGTYALPDPAVYYENVKRAWQLGPQELGVLQALCVWRESTAAREDVPRNRVVWDEHLFEFARESLLTRETVRDALPRAIAARYADKLEQVHADAQAAGRRLASLPRPLNSRQGGLVKQLRQAGLEVASRLNVAPELLCRKKELEACVRHYLDSGELAPMFTNWRRDLVGETYLELLRDASPETPGPESSR